MKQVVMDSALLTSYGGVYVGEHQLVKLRQQEGSLQKGAIYNNIYTSSVRSTHSEYGWRACTVLLKN